MERTSEMGFGGYHIIQDHDEFCYGVDAVLLATFTAERAFNGKGEKTGSPIRVLELGCGNGAVLLITSSITDWNLTGVEVQDHAYDMARRNIENCGLTERVKVISGDVKYIADKRIPEGFGHDIEALSEESFDIVMTNPPYVKNGSGIPSDNLAKELARTESTASLMDFMKAASVMLKEKGELFMVHRPSRLTDIFTAGRKFRLEPKEIMLVSPKTDAEPNIVLIHFVKGGNPELKILNSLAVHDKDGKYTEELLRRYPWKLQLE